MKAAGLPGNVIRTVLHATLTQCRCQRSIRRRRCRGLLPLLNPGCEGLILHAVRRGETRAAHATGLERVEQSLTLLLGEAEPAQAVLPDQSFVRRCHSRPCNDRFGSHAAMISDRRLAPRLPGIRTSTKRKPSPMSIWCATRGLPIWSVPINPVSRSIGAGYQISWLNGHLSDRLHSNRQTCLSSFTRMLLWRFARDRTSAYKYQDRSPVWNYKDNTLSDSFSESKFRREAKPRP